MPLARASELDRLLACAGSLVLPRDDFKPTAAARAAMWGTVCHKWKETGRLPGNEAHDKLLHRKIKASAIDRGALWPGDGEHEVALAYNVVTRRAVRCRLVGDTEKAAWKGAFSDEWVVGTLDYVLELFGEPWVDDLKTGRIVSLEAHKYQQMFYCLAWGLAAHGRPTPARSTLTHWPRYPVDAPAVRLGRVFSLDEYGAFMLRLVELRDAVVGKRVDLIVGDQCTFCPSRTACPKQKRSDDSV